MKKFISMLMALVMMVTMFGTTGVVASADYKAEIAALESNIRQWEADIAWYEANKESTAGYESIYLGTVVQNNPLIVKTMGGKYIHIINPSVAQPDITILGYFGFVEFLGYTTMTYNGYTVWEYRAVTPQTYGKEIEDLKAKIEEAELEIRNLKRDNERPYYMGVVDNNWGINSYNTVDSLSLRVGERQSVAVVVDRENGSGYYRNSLLMEDFKWSSNKSEVAKVSSDGVITAVKNGTAVITATGVNSGRKVKCTVYVTTPATDITLKKEKVNLSCGRTYTIKYTLTPTESKEPVYYLSSDETIATVNSKGKITTKNPGTAYIAVIAKSGVYKLLTVNVLKKNAPKLYYEYHAVKLAKKYHESRIQPDTICHYFTEKTDTGYKICVVDFKTNIDSYIEYITGKTDKNTRYYSALYTYDKKEKKIVEKNVDGYTFTGDYLACKEIEIYDKEFYSSYWYNYIYDIDVGQKVNFQVDVVGTPSIGEKVAWSSSNEYVATVDQNGVVTAHNFGEAVITCTMEGGASASENITVNGKYAFADVKYLEYYNLVKSDYIILNSVPSDECKFISSDESVVSVNKNKLTAVGEGSARITFKRCDGLEMVFDIYVSSTIDKYFSADFNAGDVYYCSYLPEEYYNTQHDGLSIDSSGVITIGEESNACFEIYNEESECFYSLKIYS